MAVMEVLGALSLAGLMGMVGQGARAVIGLKKLNDANAAKDPSEADAFIASRLVVSLIIGFIAGVAAALALDLKKLMALTGDDIGLLMGLAAAGYAGTDAIEGFVSRVGSSLGTSAADKSPPPPDLLAAGSAVVPAPPPPVDPNLAFGADVDSALTGVKSDIASLKSMVMDSGLVEPASLAVPIGDFLDTVTAAKVKQMFVPATPIANIVKYLPSVIGGLRAVGMTDRAMLLMALSTIRAETEGFEPISEGRSKFNTVNSPFDLYEPGTGVGKKLGNKEAGDGPRFRGRGFVQLTGRDNYTRIGKELSLPLVQKPELANDPHAAGVILGQFLKNNETAIRNDLTKGDLKSARQAVNGGLHGWDHFIDAFRKGEKLFPDTQSLNA